MAQDTDAIHAGHDMGANGSHSDANGTTAKGHDRPAAGKVNGNYVHPNGDSQQALKILDENGATIAATRLSPPVEATQSLEPIAIVGMACRLPGSATSPQKLWEMLCKGESAWSTAPKDRYNMEAFIDPDNGSPDTTNARGGHFLAEDIAAFDASFFGIAPNEAKAIDPQQRLMLEIAYEAFENAGISMHQLSGSKTGVYVGQWASDYQDVLSRDTEYTATYHALGTGPAITSNRISYQFNLKGPSFTVDTGCSAGFVALHCAVQSLRSKETEVCLVGGVSLMVDIQRFSYMSKLQMLNKDGRSYTFDSRAGGYGRGEGCCGIVLKPLSAAVRDHDSIRGIIRNSVLNSDGKTPGIGTPDSDAQQAAIRKAYADAGLERNPDYVEAHGTGTQVGDMIEVGAINAALGSVRHLTNKLPIGSVKANIGHTESTASLASLIKSVMMLERGSIPPQLNFQIPNPALRLGERNVRIPIQLERHDLNRISINSFGYGGTNAHVILDTARSVEGRHISTAPEPVTHDDITDQSSHTIPRPRVFILSAATEKSCQTLASDLADYVSKHTAVLNVESWMDNLAYTINRRSVHRYRATVTASSPEQLVDRLRIIAQQPIQPASGAREGKVALVFSGQGAQYYNMARDLLKTWPVFRQSIGRANEVLTKLGCPWKIFEELLKSKDKSQIDEPRFGQPLSTAIQLALVDTLETLGLRAAATLGHSSGEIAAAYSAGLTSFEDAMTASYHRGRLVSDLLARDSSCPGAMLAAGISPESMEEYFIRLGKQHANVEIACYNSPSSVTVSGDVDAIELLSGKLDADSKFNRKLRTRGAAYHSRQMHDIEEQYHDALDGVQCKENDAQIRMISSLTGREVGSRPVDRDYWVQNLVSPVLFDLAMKTMCKTTLDEACNLDLIVEIGPHSQLAGAINQNLQSLRGQSSDILYVPTLDRKIDSRESLLICLGKLYAEGLDVDLHSANRGFTLASPALITDLPAYPFDHSQRFWHESRLSRDYKNRSDLPHPLLGNLSKDWNRLEPRWRRYLRLDKLPWLRSHMVQGQIVFPAAAYLTMAIEAMRRHKLAQDSDAIVESFVLRNVSMGNALIIQEDAEDMEITLTLRPETRSSKSSAKNVMAFRVFTVDTACKWVERCRGTVEALLLPSSTGGDQTSQPSLLVNSADRPFEQPGSHRKVKPFKLYHMCRKFGVDWQKPFDNLISARASSASSVSVVENPVVGDTIAAGHASVYYLHPGVLDTCLFHGILPIMSVRNDINAAIVPNFIDEIFITAKHRDQPGRHFQLYCTSAGPSQTYNVTVGEKIAGEDESLVLRASGIHIAKLSGDLGSGRPSQELCHKDTWVTYCEKFTSAHLRKVCDSDRLAAGSIALDEKRVNAVVISCIKDFLRQNPHVDVAKGYRQYYFEWMKAHENEPFDERLLETQQTKPDSAAYEAIERIAQHLPTFVTGEIDPLSILTHNNILARLYQGDHYTRCHAQVALYCAELGRQNPNMRIIEIGAGTGSVTLPILEAMQNAELRSISTYHYTDISPGFFETARHNFEAYADVLDFRTLNIEHDVKAQGFEEGAYDMVVAANVVHATSDVDRSLQQARSLLRPGGVLVLVEWTESNLMNGFIFGTFEGWWAGYDDGRVMGPCIPEQQWSDRLRKAGFEQAEARLRPYDDPDSRSLSAFCAVAVSEGAKSATPSNLVLLGQAEDGALLSDLGRDLVQAGFTVQHADLLDDVLEIPEDTLTVFSPAVCETFGGHMHEPAWYAFKNRLLQSRAALFMTRGAELDVENPGGTVLDGFVRTLRIELGAELRLVRLDLDPATTDPRVATDAVLTVLRSDSFDLLTDTSQVELGFAERSGQLFVSRVMHDAQLEDTVYRTKGLLEPENVPFLDSDRAMEVGLGVAGLFETFRWTHCAEQNSELDPDYIRVETHAASINFKDVLIASGQLPGITAMHNDSSGVVVEVGLNMTERYKPGDRVCVYFSKSYSNYPAVHGDLCAHIPDSMDHDTAASLPIVWGTAYYSLINRAQLKRGETVLIHSGAGAVGQAAISIAQWVGAQIFVTVGSQAKRELIEARFGIPHDHIFSSRTTAFGQQIQEMTHGRGVDVVLNSLSGDLFRESCNSIAAFGRFIEIGKKDFMEDSLMPTRFLLRNVLFAYVDFGDLIEADKPLVQSLLLTIVRLIDNGDLRPTTVTSLPISDIEAAFRQIQAGKHVGKIVLSVSEDQQVKALPAAPAQAKLRPDALYMVVGGLGGLGKDLIQWLAARGGRHFITLSRSGALSEEASDFITEQKLRGVTIVAEKCDVSVEADFISLLTRMEHDELPPVRGVINSAMVLEDVSFKAMTYEQWAKAALRPKVMTTWNLHKHLPADLDFFIMLSSITSASGSQGQSNYSAGNSFQDGFAQYRARKGLAVRTINVGLVLDAGYASEHLEVEAQVLRQGYSHISMTDLYPLVNHAITHPLPETYVDSRKIIGIMPDRDAVTFIKDKRFRHLLHRATKSTTQSSASSIDVVHMIRSADLGDTKTIITDSIIQQISKLTGLAADKISGTMSLDDIGVDSLVAVELKNWIGAYLQANVPILVVRETKDIDELATAVFHESRLVAAKRS